MAAARVSSTNSFGMGLDSLPIMGASMVFSKGYQFPIYRYLSFILPPN